MASPQQLIQHLSCESKILVGVTGRLKSTVLFTPPMCFTVDNAKRFCQSLEDGLAYLRSTQDFSRQSDMESEKSVDLKRARLPDEGGDLGYASKKLKF